MYGNWSR